MNHSILQSRLLEMSDRFKRFQTYKGLILCWLLAAAVLVGVVMSGDPKAYIHHHTIAGFFGVLITVMLFIFMRNISQTTDVKELARTVEAEHPKLREVLRTAIEQEDNSPDGRLSFLQNRVVEEAVDRTVVLSWGQSVSSARLRRMKNLHLLSLLVFMLALVPLLNALRAPGVVAGLLAKDPAGLARPDYQILVEPGNTEVELGDRLVVTARFGERIPPEAELVVKKGDEVLNRFPMKRHLKDPTFGGIVPEVDQALEYYVNFDDRKSEDYQVDVFSFPELESVDAEVSPPAYTGLPERLEENTRYVQAIEGAEIHLRLHLNKPVEMAAMLSDKNKGLVLKPDPEHPEQMLVTLVASEKATYGVHLKDAAGRTQKTVEHIMIQVRDNQPPKIKVVFPAKDLEASPIQEIRLVAEVRDDIGLKKYGVAYAVNGEDHSVELGGDVVGPEMKSFQHVVALENHDVEPNDLLTYFFWAEDKIGDGSVRRVESDLFFVEVHHFEEIFREGMSGGGEKPPSQPGMKSQELMVDQKKVVNATWKLKRRDAGRKEYTDPRNSDIGEVQTGQEMVLEKAEGMLAEVTDAEMAEHLRTAMEFMTAAVDELGVAGDPDSPGPLDVALLSERKAYEELVKMRGREFQVMKADPQKQQSSGAPSARQRQMKTMKLRQKERNYETEKQASLERERQAQKQREVLQVLNRLRELARRQDEMTQRLKELKTALEQAEEEERAKLERELKRLTQEQKRLLQDVDQARQRVNEAEPKEETAQADQQLKETREQVRKTAENMEKGELSKAVNSSTRAQRQLEDLRDDFRKQAANQFADEMRDLRADARELEKEQNKINQDLGQEAGRETPDRKNITTRKRLISQLEEQKKKVDEIAAEVRRVSEDAEEAEPLLSRKLYDTLRDLHTRNLEGSLKSTREQLRRNRVTEAHEADERSTASVQKMREGIEEAARTVLGDEQAGLKLARNELDELIRSLDEEISDKGNRSGQREAKQAQAKGQESPPEGDQPGNREARPAEAENKPSGEGGQLGPQESKDASKGQQPGESKQEGRPTGQGQQPGKGEQPGPAQQEGRQPGEGKQPGKGEGKGAAPSDSPSSQANSPGQEGQPESSETSQRGSSRSSSRGPQRNGGDDRFGGGSSRADADDVPNAPGVEDPLTGEKFTDWSDRLRDVEEALEEPNLRNRTARILDRARAVRAEFKRHGKEPKWDVVNNDILEPMVELRERVLEELSKLSAEDSLTPIDRDPVPDPFRESVRRYYEALGEGR